MSDFGNLEKVVHENLRKHYIDNLRWSVILLLIPFHAAQAFKSWEEPNYIEFGPNKVISSIIVFFGPFVMQLLFLFAGMSMRYALEKRTYAQFSIERVKRLLVPLIFGVLVLVPPMCFLADRFHNGYSGSFFGHYIKFFTVITDMSGADGGFSFGQFWFLLYLFVLSFVLLGVIVIIKRITSDNCKGQRSGEGRSASRLLIVGVVTLGLPLPLFSNLLSVGGKSFVEFFYFLLIGYYVFTRKTVAEKAEKYSIIFLVTGTVAGAVNVYLFVFSGLDFPVINTIVKYICEWFMVLGLFGIGRRFLDRENTVTRYFTRISYPFFSFHFVFVILFQYLFSDAFKGNTFLQYIIPVIISFIATIICCRIALSIPVICFLVGVKSKSGMSVSQRIANVYMRLSRNRHVGHDPEDRGDINLTQNEELEKYLVNGLIEDQSSLKEMHLGVSDMAYAGCEVIAVYNVLWLSGQKHDLSELIYRAERSGALMRKGKWGTNPFSLDKLCPDEGVSLKRIKNLPTESGIYILSFWNSRRIKDGLHTVCVQITEGEIKVYNSCSLLNRQEETGRNQLESLFMNKPIIAIYCISLC